MDNKYRIIKFNSNIISKKDKIIDICHSINQKHFKNVYMITINVSGAGSKFFFLLDGYSVFNFSGAVKTPKIMHFENPNHIYSYWAQTIFINELAENINGNIEHFDNYIGSSALPPNKSFFSWLKFHFVPKKQFSSNEDKVKQMREEYADILSQLPEQILRIENKYSALM